MRSLRQQSVSGLSTPFITRRRYPTRGMVRRRVYREHRRVSNLEPDDNKPLTYAGYCGYRRVRRVI